MLMSHFCSITAFKCKNQTVFTQFGNPKLHFMEIIDYIKKKFNSNSAKAWWAEDDSAREEPAAEREALRFLLLECTTAICSKF